MNWQNAIALLAALALLLPVVLITAFRLFRYSNYLALLAYCIMTLGYNLIPLFKNVIHIPPNTIRSWGLINNLLDMPLMLLFMMIFSATPQQKRRMKIYFVLFVAFEIVILSIYGFTLKAVTITMGPGLVMIFSIAFFFFVRKVKQSIIQNKALGKAFIAGGITFVYGCFGFIYLMHYVIGVNDLPKIFLIYYIVVMIFCGLLSTGLVLENKRIRKREELIQTRKELVQFFAEEKKPVTPKESSNNEQWQWKTP